MAKVARTSTQQILLEVVINGIRIFPPTTDIPVEFKKRYSRDNRLKKVLQDYSVTKFSQINVESVRVAYGGGAFDIEVVIFDPTMDAADILLYGVPFQDHEIKVVMGWQPVTDYTGESRTFEGLIRSIKPEIIAGGIRYTLNYIYKWVEYGAIKNDAAFAEMIIGLFEDGEFSIDPCGFGPPDDDAYNSGPITGDDFFIGLRWVFKERLPLLSSWRIMEKLQSIYNKGDITVKVNGEEGVIFKKEFVNSVKNLTKELEELKKISDSERGNIWATKAWEKKKDIERFYKRAFEYNEIFTDFNSLRWSDERGSGRPKLDYKLEFVSDDVYSVPIVSKNIINYFNTYRSGKNFEAFSPDVANFTNSFNVIHILLIFAAIYGFDVEIDPKIIRPSTDTTDAFELARIAEEMELKEIGAFIATKMMPLSYLVYKDIRENGLIDKFDEILRNANIIKDNLPNQVWSDYKYKGSLIYRWFRIKYASRLWVAEAIGRALDYMMSQVFLNKNIDKESVKAEMSTMYLRASPPLPEGELHIQGDFVRSLFPDEDGEEIDLEENIRKPQDFYGDITINRGIDQKILYFLQKMFRVFGFYSPNGFSKLDTDIDLYRLYLDLAPNPITGKLALKVKGEYVDMRMEPSHVFTFPRQITEGEVTDFSVVSDGSLFLPFYTGPIFEDSIVISSGTPKQNANSSLKPVLFKGETVDSLYSSVNLSKIQELVDRTESAYFRIDITYPFISSVGGKRPYSLGVFLNAIVNFQKHGIIQISMRMLGRVSLDIMDWIFIGITKANNTLHHISGVYLVTGVLHELAGASFVTTIEAVRTGTYSIGLTENVIKNSRNVIISERREK